jgi:hypothetical protein
MPHPAANTSRRMTGEMLIAAFLGGRPPRGTKLAPSVWQQAATLFAEYEGKLTLREIREECGVSHKTAWRIRELLRDAAHVIREKNARSSHIHHVSKEYHHAGRYRSQIPV